MCGITREQIRHRPRQKNKVTTSKGWLVLSEGGSQKKTPRPHRPPTDCCSWIVLLRRPDVFQELRHPLGLHCGIDLQVMEGGAEQRGKENEEG